MGLTLQTTLKLFVVYGNNIPPTITTTTITNKQKINNKINKQKNTHKKEEKKTTDNIADNNNNNNKNVEGKETAFFLNIFINITHAHAPAYMNTD